MLVWLDINCLSTSNYDISADSYPLQGKSRCRHSVDVSDNVFVRVYGYVGKVSLRRIFAIPGSLGAVLFSHVLHGVVFVSRTNEYVFER